MGLAVLAVPVLFLVNAFHHYTPVVGLAVLVTFGAVVVLTAVLVPIFSSRARNMQRRELDAGYTTLTPEFDQVDGIDPVTKMVVRPAKTGVTFWTDDDRITTGNDRGVIDTGRTPFQIVVRRRTAVTAETVSLIVLIGCVYWFVLYVLPVPRPSQGLVVVLLLLAVVAFFVAVTVPTVVIRFVPAWYYTARLRDSVRDATAYQATPNNDDIVEELAGIDAPALPGSRFQPASYLLCTSDHLVLFSRHGKVLIPYLDVPRSRIVDARVGSSVAGTGGSSLSAPVLTFRKDNGTELKVTFSLTAPSYPSGRKRFERDSQEIVDWANTRRSPE
jgi:hypothetical protein